MLELFSSPQRVSFYTFLLKFNKESFPRIKFYKVSISKRHETDLDVLSRRPKSSSTSKKRKRKAVKHAREIFMQCLFAE
jgi:hypothetical protein